MTRIVDRRRSLHLDYSNGFIFLEPLLKTTQNLFMKHCLLFLFHSIFFINETRRDIGHIRDMNEKEE